MNIKKKTFTGAQRRLTITLNIPGSQSEERPGAKQQVVEHLWALGRSYLSTFLILACITFCFVSTNQVPELAAITHPVQINSNLPKLRFKDSGIWLREGPSMPVIVVISFPLCRIN